MSRASRGDPKMMIPIIVIQQSEGVRSLVFNSQLLRSTYKIYMTEQFPEEFFGPLFANFFRQSAMAAPPLPLQTHDWRQTHTILQKLAAEGKVNFGTGSADIKSLSASENGSDCYCKSVADTSCTAASICHSLQNSSSFGVNLTKEAQFLCPFCQESEADCYCCKCQGSRKIGESSNLAQFMEYMIGFKSGKVGSYQPTSTPKKTIKVNNVTESDPTANRKCQPKNMTQKYQTLKTFIARGKLQCQTHVGYSCDNCHADPIRGIRFHCPHPDCQDNYDLCGDCYSKVEHQHELLMYSENGFRKYAESLTQLVEGKKRRQKNLRMHNSRSRIPETAEVRRSLKTQKTMM